VSARGAVRIGRAVRAGRPVSVRRAAAALAIVAVLLTGCDLLADTNPAATPAAMGPAAPWASSWPSTAPLAAGTAAPAATPVPAPWGPGLSAFMSRLLALPQDVMRARPRGAARPTRVAIPSLGIDLPVVVPAKNERFPPCNVAEFLSTFDWPGQGGTTYVYAHARRGMFLPILTASWRKNGKAMLGDAVYVWTDDDLRYEYRIGRVRRRQHSLDWALRLPPESLVLQTSETPYATGTKMMLVARFQDVQPATHRKAHPKAKPLRCG
jgi:hypothetical protein